MSKTVSGEELEKINGYAREPLTEDKVFVFRVALCDNDIDRDGEKFSSGALEKLAELFKGRTGIFDHDPKSSKQTARIFDTWVETLPEKTTTDGEVYRRLMAKAYMVRTSSNGDLISEIQSGIMDIKKIINNFVEAHIDEIEAAIHSALSEEKSINEIKAGDHFEYKGIEWVCLDVGNETVFAVTAKVIANMPFSDKLESGCNNWRTSSLRKWLNGEFFDKNFDKGVLLANFSTLTADNGDDKYGAVEDYVTLLDCNQYRRCRKLMPKYGDWVWTLTPHSCNGDARHVHIIRQSGDLERNIAFNPVGVAPACLFNLNYLSSCWQAHIITHK